MVHELLFFPSKNIGGKFSMKCTLFFIENDFSWDYGQLSLCWNYSAAHASFLVFV